MSLDPQTIKAVPFDERFLDATWTWLQDRDLHWIIDARQQTREEQRRWFQSLPERRDYAIWGVECEGTPVAVFGLKNIAANGSGEWFMFIGTQEFRGRGIGDWIVAEIETKARERGLNELWGRIRPENEHIKRLLRRNGFEIGQTEEGGRLRIRKRLDTV
ncbi:MAG TPA: GNAT family N-acetyltransferase [Candidatus Dormibacteraeota bacterium]